jgi:hypothetical protein
LRHRAEHPCDVCGVARDDGQFQIRAARLRHVAHGDARNSDALRQRRFEVCEQARPGEVASVNDAVRGFERAHLIRRERLRDGGGFGAQRLGFRAQGTHIRLDQIRLGARLPELADCEDQR